MHYCRYLTKFYQFLLVFETEVCQHFVSPRLFRALAIDNNDSGLIPIVFGGVNYSKMFKMSVISRSHKPSSIKSRVGHIFVPSFSVIIQLCSTKSALFSRHQQWLKLGHFLIMGTSKMCNSWQEFFMLIILNVWFLQTLAKRLRQSN